MIARAAVVAGVAALAGSAVADRAKLAAITAAPDLRHAIAIGPAGEAYEPDGHGGWARTRACDIAGDVTAATHAGQSAIAVVADQPPYRWATDGWTVLELAPHARPVVGAGPRAVAAVGRTVFALDGPHPQKLADAPAPVLALAASPKGLVIATDGGLLRLERGGWKPIAGAPAQIAALLSDRFALVEHGVLDLQTGRTIAWPDGVHVAIATAIDDAVVGVSGPELVTVRAGKVTREPIPVDPASPIVGVVADRDGRALCATRDGRVIAKDRGAWTAAAVRDELPAPRPGAPPATSR